MTPAPYANDPLCAEVTTRLPASISDFNRRWTDAQSTGAWGDPTAILYVCGVEQASASEQQCITLGGSDWLVNHEKDRYYRVTLYSRTPGVELYIDSHARSGTDGNPLSADSVINSFAPLVRPLSPSGNRCVDRTG